MRKKAGERGARVLFAGLSLFTFWPFLALDFSGGEVCVGFRALGFQGFQVRGLPGTQRTYRFRAPYYDFVI